MLVSQVPPIAGIERRSRVLGRRIQEAFGGEPVHLIGHSMGGLDARALLASEGNAGLVLSLTTIGTPHLGSALADYAKIGFGRVYGLFKALQIDHSGLPRHHPARRPGPSTAATRRRAGVPCFSVAGHPAAEDVCLPLRRLHAILDEVEGPERRRRLGRVGPRLRRAFAGLASRPSPSGRLARAEAGAVGDLALSATSSRPSRRKASRLRGVPSLSRRAGASRPHCDAAQSGHRRRRRSSEGPRRNAAGSRRPYDGTSTRLSSGFPAVRSRRTATVMSPRTLDEVRQRSRNQSIVRMIGIFSAGSPTAREDQAGA